MSTTIKVAGKESPVKFTLRSLKVYEKLTGRNLVMENFMHIVNFSLGVDAFLAFIYCSLQVEPGKEPSITLEDIELSGIDNEMISTVTDAYIDFIPGMSKLRKKIMEDPEMKAKIEEAGNDPQKLLALMMESLPNMMSQPVK